MNRFQMVRLTETADCARARNWSYPHLLAQGARAPEHYLSNY